MVTNPSTRPSFRHAFRQFLSKSDQAIGSGINVPLLRGIVGVLGLVLPVVLVVWGFFILHGWHFFGSLSQYYSERTRDAFVGILFAIGCVLFAYNGYSKMDGYFGKAACILAILVAVFPCTSTDWQSTIHLVSACLLFVVFALFSLVLFTKTKDSPQDFKGTIKSILLFGLSKQSLVMKSGKKRRNWIYRACGIIILACLLVIGLYYWLWQHTFLENTTFVLIMEWIMIWAFGFSWLVKSDIIPVLKD